MPFDLILKGGTVLDPAQALHAVRDIAIRDGKIALIPESILEPAERTLDVTGLLVTPGFVDIHTHLYAGVTTWGVKPDPAALRSGVTTLVDAGSASHVTLRGFRWYIAEPARARVLTFVHISALGLLYGRVGEMSDMRYAAPEKCAQAVLENPDLTVGVKVRQGIDQVGENGVEPLRLAVRAAEQANTRVMVHIGVGVPLPSVLKLLRPGDIVTHCFQGNGDSILDEAGSILPDVQAARRDGIIMDVGHGAGSFRWSVAERALDQGFLPDVISTDLHTGNILGPVHDMPTTLSKFLHLGLGLSESILAATRSAAQTVGRTNLGTLAVGGPADLAVLDLREGEFELFDTHGTARTARRRLVPCYTVAGGRVFTPEDIAPNLPEEIRQRYDV